MIALMKRQTKYKTITLKDIAAKVGCSKNTVSLALRDSNRISQKMRKRIAKVADKLGYVPNFAARNLSTRRSGMIGLYTLALYDAVRAELINSLIDELHTAEYRPVLGLGQKQPLPWYESPWMKTFRELNVEAMVVVAEAGGQLPDWLERIPTILVGCHPSEQFQCDYIALDRKEAARDGIKYLISCGHRKILVAGQQTSVFGQGCFEALSDAGLKPYHVPVNYYPNEDEEPINALIDCVTRRYDKPTAVIFGDSPLAGRFMLHLQKYDVKIPEALAVIGYDYFPCANMLKVPLTTLEQPISELAAQAISLIKNRLANPDLPITHTVIPHKLVIRKSS